MASILDDVTTRPQILSNYITAIDNLLGIADEMNDAEIDVRTTLAQIRGMTDVTLELLGVNISYERNSDTE